MQRRPFVVAAAAWPLLAGSGHARAQALELQWGLQNEWAYREEKPVRSAGRVERRFEFNEGRAEVREPWLRCIDTVMALWPAFSASAAGRVHPPAAEATRMAFQAHVRSVNPGCVAQFRKTAPQLYFDFVAGNAAEWVLDEVQVRTIAFSEYRGGGFAESEAWYDVLLSPRPGTKAFRPEPRLHFKGHGRVVLRLWSGNFYPQVGWIAPMGEYTLDIGFVFAVEGRRVEVRTGPFRIEV